MILSQTLDEIRAYVETLERQLAEADSLISAHAFTIDKSPPEKWPKDSQIKAAMERHARRCAERLKYRMDGTQRWQA